MITDVCTMSSLPSAARHTAAEWEIALESVTPPIVESLNRVAAQMGVSYGSARMKYYAWRSQNGDPTVLAPRTGGGPVAGTSPEFVEWYRALVEKHQRNTKAAWYEFSKRWHAGANIPGLPETVTRSRMPRGTSYPHLQRVLCKLGMTVIRRGMSHAKAMTPQVLTTRVGLWCGSHIMFDDLWHDNYVVAQGAPVRVLEFDAMDVFSGCKIAWGCRPRTQREDGTNEGLTEGMMRMIVANVLWNCGYSPRGTTFVVEHGTAAIRETLERLLYDATGHLVKVQRGGFVGSTQALASQRGQGRGNPRHKAGLESFRNLIHNQLQTLPGQTGLDWEHEPESSFGVLAETRDILKAAAVLSVERPDLVELLRLPLLEYHGQFLPLLAEVYQRVNRRDWHKLEGWTECGHMVIEYRLNPDSQDWMTPAQVLALPAPAQQALQQLARADAQFVRQRPLSPAEVWDRRQLQKAPAWLIAEILGPDCAREAVVRRGLFEVQDITVEPEPMLFESRITEPGGAERELILGEKYLVHLNPFDPRQLFVHDAAGRCLGVAARSRRVARHDEEALRRQLGRVNHRLADLLAPIRARHAEVVREDIARRDHNARVLAGTAEVFPPVSTRGVRDDDFENLDSLPQASAPITRAAGQVAAMDEL